MRSLTYPLSIVACLLSGIADAQQPSSGLGLKGGPELTSWRSAARAYRPMMGFVAGLYAPIGLANRVELQPEVLLSYQGAGWEAPEEGHHTIRELKVQFPITAKYFLDRTLNLQAGAYGAFELQAHQDGSDIQDRMRPMEMGMMVGIGIDGQTGLDLSLRYAGGMTSLLEQDLVLYPTTRALQLACGYRFVQFRAKRRRHL